MTWRVRWLEGGRRGGRPDGETCDDKTTARNFRIMVEAAGERRPEGYPKGCRGRKPMAAEPEPEAEAPALGQVFDEYLAQLKRAEDQQVAKYQKLFDQHVRIAVLTLEDGSKVGPLGGLLINEFTTEIDEAWVAWMGTRTYLRRKARKKGEKDDVRPYSPKTIHNIHGGVISPTLAYAARKHGKHLPVNPCVGVELPDKPAKAVNLDHVPTGAEIENWIEIGYEVSTLTGDVITLAMGTGLRWSEMTALRPCDFDLDRALLTVNQVMKQDGRRRWYIASYGKTDAAKRTIRIPANVVKMLQRRIEGLGRKDLIFRGARGGFLNSSSWYSTQWPKVIEKAVKRGIMTAATPHKFRHAHATGLLADNVSLDTVSKRLGHKSIVVTSDLYSHLSPEADQRAVEVIDGLMTGRTDKDTRVPAAAA